MLKTYKTLSLLLSYPTAELRDFLLETASELKSEGVLPVENMEEINSFARHYSAKDLTDWQAEYVQLFDYSRSASLYLFEHIKGDSKDRGQAMVDLLGFYRDNGMELTSHELPDYIPAFLEFLSTLEMEKAAELLAEPLPVIDRIYLALKEKNHPYQYVLSAIVSLPARKPDQKVTETIIRNEKPPDLDGEYEENSFHSGGDNSFIICKK